MAALTWNEIKARAVSFSKEWANEGYEDGEAKSFLDAFFNVFGVSRRRFIKFERRVQTEDGRSGFIDSIWKGVILVEMKSLGKSLDKAYEQARGYFFGLSDSELPRYVLVSDFQNFRLYDLDENLQWDFPLRDLVKKVKLFGFLAGYQHTDVKEQDPVNIRAAEEMGKIHDEMKAIGYSGHHLELYLVRILFCLFADDTTLFNKNQFFDYVSQSREDGSDLAMRLGQLFEVLNTAPERRLKTLPEDLAAFPYVNGQLFAEQLPMAGFTSQMRQHLLSCCRVDWGAVSPAIFGSMFQSVMNPEERRALGAHYTSEENIHKVINPLFLDDLKAEYESCKGNKRRLEAFHNKLAGLKFMDPACGCGNFLIITYKELRLLEIEVMKQLLGDTQLIDVALMAKVNVNQFYGIEIEEFPAQIAQVAMWLMDHQMNMKMSEEFGFYFARLPLLTKANIMNGNALRIDWNMIINKNELSFIMGNPPFIGHQWRTQSQMDDMHLIFSNNKQAGRLDYVAAWYKKTAEYVQDTTIKAAFVSTNSITQGEQVGILWPELIQQMNIRINFAHRTFQWQNEAKGQAAVHVVVIGFSLYEIPIKRIFHYESLTGNPTVQIALNINPYLIDGKTVFIKSRAKPLNDMPTMNKGSQPTCGGNLILSESEKSELITKYAESAVWIKEFIGGDEFINNRKRYCLWLKGVSPVNYVKIPEIMKRLRQVSEFRLTSPTASVREFARFPALFTQDRQPDTFYLVIPEVSSEQREYIPIGFLSPEVIASNKLQIIPNADLYLFGILTSGMHMAWMRTICGRMKSDYSYSPSIYFNFPFPDQTDKSRTAIEALANRVLEVRASYEELSLAVLYNRLTMPPELVKAHNKLDAVVEKAYGKRFNTDSDRVAFLFERYSELVN